MLKPSLQLRLSQQLTMTPQLQQAIRLLQLPIMDLQAQIQEALEKNVMLETAEDSAERDASETPDKTSDTDVRVVETSNWQDSPGAPAASNWSGDEPRQTPDYADLSGDTLQDHVLWQLELEHLSLRDMVIGQSIIDAINDDGYLVDDLETIVESLEPDIKTDIEHVERLLRKIQRLDPAGVGARSVSECLSLQLRQLNHDTPGLELAHTLAEEHLELVADHQFATLRRRLRVSEDDLENAIALVKACHPRPGAVIQSGTPHYVVPDVFIRKQDEHWVVEVNSSVAPRLRVNQTYAGLLGRGSDHTALKTQLQEARWLIRSLEIRNETLIKVARCIVQRQKDFLELGDEAMRPLVLRDIAEAVDMHESTISRVTTNKYMHTPRGVFEFRFFFSSHIKSSDGTEQSSTAIRAKIRKLVAQEDSKKPLSDNKIAQLLSEDGIKVARRTVAKYREAMTIPPSSERKKLALR